MNRKMMTIISLLAAMSVLLSACNGSETGAELPKGAAVPPGPVLITGSFEYTNDFVVETYYVEHAVMLTDITSFVLRDQEWELPIESQVLGYVEVDEENNRAEYRLALPVVPEGQAQDVDNDGQQDKGVQIFVVAYSPNLTGGVFSEGDDRSMGWPAYLASITTDTENQDELTGGKLLIWAADGEQKFPAGFGEDGLLFTEDDPSMDVPAGYAVIDLDQEPFGIIRDQQVEMMLYEPSDVAVKDFSDKTYVEAFEEMFAIVRNEYAFNGFAGKEPDWEALYAQTKKRVEQAQDERNPYAYFMALRDFTLAFNDGHVGISAGDEVQQYFYYFNLWGSYGIALRELDDKRVVVVYVLENSEADLANVPLEVLIERAGLSASDVQQLEGDYPYGIPKNAILENSAITAGELAELKAQYGEGIQVGAEISVVDSVPVGEAIENTQVFDPQSTDFGRRYEKVLMLLRGSVGEPVTLTYRNPGGQERTVSMVSQPEMYSFMQTYRDGMHTSLYDDALPAEYEILPEGIGYVKINSNYDDLNLLVRLFERALQTFEENGIPYLIIDMRKNLGGANLGLAGFLYDEEIPLGQLEYYSERTGQFEPEGPRDKVLPNVEQYAFEKMVLLVDQFCYSACELESYGFSQVPGMTVMGQFPTAGVEAEVARGEFLMPDDITLNIPTGRFTNPDGSLFLEGEGVVPDVRLAVDAESVLSLSDQDIVLQKAIAYILQ